LRTENQYDEHLQAAKSGMTDSEKLIDGRLMMMEGQKAMRLGVPHDLLKWQDSIEGVEVGQFVWFECKEALRNTRLRTPDNFQWTPVGNGEVLCKVRLAVVSAVLRGKLLLRVLTKFDDTKIENKRKLMVTDGANGATRPFLRDFMQVVEISAKESAKKEENCFKNGTQMYWRSEPSETPKKKVSYMPLGGDTYTLLDTTIFDRKPLLQVVGSLVNSKDIYGIERYEFDCTGQRYNAQKQEQETKEANANIGNHLETASEVRRRVADPPLNTHGPSNNPIPAQENVDAVHSFAGMLTEPDGNPDMRHGNPQASTLTSEVERPRNRASPTMPCTGMGNLGVNSAAFDHIP
jgi:hypothetical protein